MFQLATQPQSVGKVLDESIRLFFASFKHVFILSLVATAVVMLPNFMMNDALTAAGEDLTQMQAVFAEFFVWLGAGMLVFVVFYNAIFFNIDRISHGGESATGQSLAVGLRKLVTVIVAMILYFLAVVIGSLLLIIPGIILMLSLFFYTPLAVCDDLGPVETLKKSHNLVWGNWWRTTAVFLVPFFIMMILGFLFALVIGFVVAMTGPAEGAESIESQAGLNQIGNLIMALFYVIIYPYFASLMLVQLNDLKLRKKGSDLEARVAATA